MVMVGQLVDQVCVCRLHGCEALLAAGEGKDQAKMSALLRFTPQTSCGLGPSSFLVVAVRPRTP